MLGIIVKTDFEGIHCYPKAPDEVKFLRVPHRHVFHVEVEVETFHEDREIEFIKLKHELDQKIDLDYGKVDLGTTSCEQIAVNLQTWIKKRYEPYHHNTRKVNVKVFEDLENGAFVKEF